MPVNTEMNPPLKFKEFLDSLATLNFSSKTASQLDRQNMWRMLGRRSIQNFGWKA
jgi:hypothetical protein